MFTLLNLKFPNDSAKISSLAISLFSEDLGKAFTL